MYSFLTKFVAKKRCSIYNGFVFFPVVPEGLGRSGDLVGFIPTYPGTFPTS